MAGGGGVGGFRLGNRYSEAHVRHYQSQSMKMVLIIKAFQIVLL